MSTVTWVARQEKRAQVDTLTVGSSTAGQTFSVTCGVKVITYTAVTGDTTSTIASALYALLASSSEGEFAELTYTSPTAAVITVTGPSDGEPFTITAGGTGTLTDATITAPLSPSDLSDGKNYSTGALPNAGDALVFENNSTGAMYNVTALAGIALASVTRRASFTGELGLPAVNASYVEYRASEVQFNAPVLFFEQGPSDSAGQFRIQSVSTPAVTLTIQGGGSTASVGNEVLQVRGLPASSVLLANGGSVAVCPYAGQTASLTSIAAQNATVWCGPGVTLGATTFTNSTYRLDCSFTSLTHLSASSGDVEGSAACGNSGLKVYNGTLLWRSTGATGANPVIGNGGALDFSQAPGQVTVGGTVSLYAGATWNDPASKVNTSYTFNTVNCGLGDVAINCGLNHSFAVS